MLTTNTHWSRLSESTRCHVAQTQLGKKYAQAQISTAKVALLRSYKSMDCASQCARTDADLHLWKSLLSRSCACVGVLNTECWPTVMSFSLEMSIFRRPMAQMHVKRSSGEYLRNLSATIPAKVRFSVACTHNQIEEGKSSMK